MISIRVYLLVAVVFSLFNFSCSDDKIVTPPEEPYQFDSARFSWEINRVNMRLLDFQIFDTSNICFLGFSNLVQYDGVNFLTHHFGFDGLFAISMDGYDKENIYIGGHDNSPGSNNGKPKLKKWDGINFQEIPIKDSSSRKYQISTISAKDQNIVWMGSTRGDLIHYDNGYFQFFRIDSTFRVTDFSTDEAGNDYITSVKTIFDRFPTRYLNIYKKVSNEWKWEKVFSEVYYNEDDIIPSKIGNHLSGFKGSSILKFSENNFFEIFKINHFIPYRLNELSDSTINFFMIPGAYDNTSLKLFNWNGIKWSEEISFIERGIDGVFFPKIVNYDGIYFFLCIDEWGVSYVGKGNQKIFNH